MGANTSRSLQQMEEGESPRLGGGGGGGGGASGSTTGGGNGGGAGNSRGEANSNLNGRRGGGGNDLEDEEMEEDSDVSTEYDNDSSLESPRRPLTDDLISVFQILIRK